MKVVDLRHRGFINTKLREDGTVICWNGREINRPYPSGQVYIPWGPKMGGTYVNLAKLVAEEFVPNPYDYDYVMHIDGDKFNCRADNLMWVKKKPRSRRLNAEEFLKVRTRIIDLYVTKGMKAHQIAPYVPLSIPAVQKIIDEFEEMLKDCP